MTPVAWLAPPEERQATKPMRLYIAETASADDDYHFLLPSLEGSIISALSTFDDVDSSRAFRLLTVT